MKPPRRLTNADRNAANIFSRERRFRATGVWPLFRYFDTKPKSGGWLGEMRRCAENGAFLIMWRETEVPVFGAVTHAFIQTASKATDITWAEKQRIKNAIFGRERAAIEVYPRHSQLVDDANAYHLWILPKGHDFPVTIAGPGADAETPTEAPDAARQD